jgi:hypothetical protein
VFLVEDGTGIGVPVLFGFVKHETTDILHNVLQWFTVSVDIAVTRVIMVDNDLKMLNLLQATFSNSTVLLCRFHVLHYIRKKIQSLSVLTDVKKQLLSIMSTMVYASDTVEYDAAFETLRVQL